MDAATGQAMNTIPALRNYTDIEGDPVCPTCGRPIRSSEGVMRVDDCMIHAACYTVARTLPEPCEYTP
jgi:hypothetical protein